MDVSSAWIVVLAIATPVAGVVGFAIQLRQVRKSQLENEKLQLEIEALRAKLAESEQRIVRATTEEVLKVAHKRPMFSRSGQLDSRPASDNQLKYEASRADLRDNTIIAAVVLIAIFFIAYLLYDLYRLGLWLVSKL